MWVPGAVFSAVCLCPGIRCDVQTRRAWWPWYQPKRNALTWNDFAVVLTYRRKLWPGRTLCWSAYPSMASGAPRSVIRQAEVPGRLSSWTGNGCVAAADGAEVAVLGRGPAEPWCTDAVHAAAGSVTARAAAMPRTWRSRLLVTRLTETHHDTAVLCRVPAPASGQENEARRPAFAEPH